MQNFYSLLDLDPNQTFQQDQDKLLAKLMAKNSFNHSIIKRYYKRHINRPLLPKPCQSLPILNYNRPNIKPQRIIRKEATLSQQPSKLELVKLEIVCSDQRNHHVSSPSLKEGERTNNSNIINMQLGIVNLSIQKHQKNARMTKIYFQVLKKYNKCFGRRIPIRSSGVSNPHPLEMTTQRFFWNDDKLMIVKSQAILPRIKKIL